MYVRKYREYYALMTLYVVDKIKKQNKIRMIPNKNSDHIRGEICVSSQEKQEGLR